MLARLLKWSAFAVFAFALAGVIAAGSARAEEKKDKKDEKKDEIPKKVMDALKAKFPKAEIRKWTKEKEGDKVVYDIEFKQDGKKFEADIFEDGTIHNWEREIQAKDLPKAVTDAVEKKYPKSKDGAWQVKDIDARDAKALEPRVRFYLAGKYDAPAKPAK